MRREEKQTDVAIGAHLVNDLYTRDFEVAVLVTGDADVMAAIEIAHTIRPVHVRAAFPPKRASADLKAIADDYRYVRAKHVEQCLLPNPVIAEDGSRFTMPPEWEDG